MSFNLEKSYIENLKKYVGKDLNIIESENRIEVIQDSEIQYILEKNSKNNYIFYCMERGIKFILGEYLLEIEMRRKFAIAINGFLGEKINYNNGDEFQEGKDIVEIEKLMNLYVGKEYYSIKNPKKMKMNLEEEEEKGKYSIYLLGLNGEKVYKEKKLDAPFVFFRFYSEALFFKISIERINKYEKIFNDILGSKEKYNLIIS